MDEKEIRERARHLVARMLRSLPIDTVARILADAEFSYRLKGRPLLPREIERRDPEAQGPFGSVACGSSKAAEGIRELTSQLVDMWLAKPIAGGGW